MLLPTIDELIDRSIAAYKKEDRGEASKLLAQVIKIDPNNERAWLQVSGLVSSAAERLFCIKRLLTINPENEVAKHGLALLDPNIVPVEPSLEKPKTETVEICAVPGCDVFVSKPGDDFCEKHAPGPLTGRFKSQAALSAAELGEKFRMAGRRMNFVLAELGWIEKLQKGWIPTEQGKAVGAVRKELDKPGDPEVLWPGTILNNKVLLSTIKCLVGEVEVPTPRAANGTEESEQNYTVSHRAADGHWVRSNAELLIDNWLYTSGIAHAYERQLPIEEDLFCDFYIPEGKVYLEYWDPQENTLSFGTKKTKLEIYQKHAFNLIELTDDLIKNLDDFLPKVLLKFKIILN